MILNYFAHPPLRVQWDIPELVRARESRVFALGRFNAPEMVALLICEAFLCGCRDARVDRTDSGWWIVRSTEDWITESDRLSPFVRTVTYRQGGPNSVRAEIYLTVFATAVVTASAEGYFMLKGQSGPVLAELVGASHEFGRLIGFRE